MERARDDAAGARLFLRPLDLDFFGDFLRVPAGERYNEERDVSSLSLS